MRILNRRNLLLLSGAPLRALAQTCQAVFMPVIRSNNVARIPAHLVSSDVAEKIRHAYELMACLPADDHRSLVSQCSAHWDACHHLGIHQSNDFALWHRAFLYYHERILGSLVNDPDLRIPYWAWDSSVSEHRKIPAWLKQEKFTPAFNTLVTRRDEDIPLWDGSDYAHQKFPQSLAILQNDSHKFQRLALEEMHAGPHRRFGKRENPIKYSAADPLFYAHHANVDRLVETFLTDVNHWPDSSTPYSFYDETNTLSTPALKNFQKIADWKYFYQDYPESVKIPGNGFSATPIRLMDVSKHNELIQLEIELNAPLAAGKSSVVLGNMHISETVTLEEGTRNSMRVFVDSHMLTGIDLTKVEAKVGVQTGSVKSATLITAKP